MLRLKQERKKQRNSSVSEGEAILHTQIKMELTAYSDYVLQNLEDRFSRLNQLQKKPNFSLPAEMEALKEKSFSEVVQGIKEVYGSLKQ